LRTVVRRPTAADTKNTKNTKTTKTSCLFFLVAFVIFVGFVSRPWAVSAQASAVSPQSTAAKTMAITFDDLPKVQGFVDIKGSRRTTESILKVLKAHNAPAVAFVNEYRLHDGDRVIPERVALLQSWIDAGIPLGNHTYSHPDINTVPLSVYEKDIERGEAIHQRLMKASPLGRGDWRWFRHPFTHTGQTPEVKSGLEKYLAGRGYLVAPFTIENSDYLFSPIYTKATKAGDTALAARARDEYLAYSDRMVEWFETLARDTFGRDVPQILLIHANDLHTDALAELLTRIERRGYRWVTLSDAMKDPAYQTPDEFVGKFGPSWLHRWRVAKKLPSRMPEEPDPPKWVLNFAK
jgi:peptidoglycan/xylan/chitin deacetylase (PgdA/CDA1 family)